MLRSLFSGISGLRAHQQMMDVVGNNIANVNTAGFKSSSTVFQDTLSQMLRGAGAPQNGTGGTNPAQIGLGVQLAAITTNFGQGASQTTGRATDLMIQGDGFFVVQKDGQDLFTRAGAFSFDQSGKLVSPDGAVVQGWAADSAGKIDSNVSPTGITLPMATLLAPTATTQASLGGNLPASATPYDAGPPEAGTKILTKVVAHDGEGSEYPVTLTLTANAPATTGDPVTSWTVHISGGTDASGKPIDLTPSTAPTVTFDPTTGKLVDSSGQPLDPAKATFDIPMDNAGKTWGTGSTITIDYSTLTMYGGEKTVAAGYANGSAMGGLQSFTMSPDGTLVGVFSNGLKQPLGQIALATFNNPPGLEKVGGSMYRTTANSGDAMLGTAGSAGRGTLTSGALEMSNVDLAQEFTNLIIAQRGFQANSKVITSADEILQDLVNLKR